jgi:hypothetical protein
VEYTVSKWDKELEIVKGRKLGDFEKKGGG